MIEDDPSVSAALFSVLTRAGHSCIRSTRGADLLPRHREADVVLLDLGLEDMDGLEALRQLREVSDMPLIVVTARGDERSTVRALRLGADDYLVKPVRLHELLARLESVTRRYGGRSAPEFFELGEVTVDTSAIRVLHGESEIGLTPTEFALLTALARHAGTAVSRQTLLDDVWPEGYPADSRAFDVHLGQLRQKLPMLTITTIRGYGFRLEPTA
ncbi:response regulator transcription factor [Gulosibacter molinativorax]|nr:response regulator transcription factor [Gulosibacter molinativorax]QUY63137.1 Two-component system response regulator [Gulosibacter molinativorax]